MLERYPRPKRAAGKGETARPWRRAERAAPGGKGTEGEEKKPKVVLPKAKPKAVPLRSGGRELPRTCARELRTYALDGNATRRDGKRSDLLRGTVPSSSSGRRSPPGPSWWCGTTTSRAARNEQARKRGIAFLAAALATRGSKGALARRSRTGGTPGGARAFATHWEACYPVCPWPARRPARLQAGRVACSRCLRSGGTSRPSPRRSRAMRSSWTVRRLGTSSDRGLTHSMLFPRSRLMLTLFELS